MSAHILERDAKHRYRCVNPEHTSEPCHGVVFESVTTILGRAVPKNLAWHGQTRGVIGVKGLLKIPKYDVQHMKPNEIVQACAAEGIDTDPLGRHRVKLSAVSKYDIAKMRPDDITAALKRERLTVNDHMREAGKGGTAVHKALEDYADKGVLPNAQAVPESKRGSVRGLAKFIVEYRPEIIGAEQRILSVKHGYAGTFDLLCRIKARREGRRLVADATAKPLLVLADLKTSKWVYPSSHFPQLEAYEGARVEMGEPPTDVRAVIWTNAQGDMELVPSTASFEDFLALKASAEVIGRLDRSYRRPRRTRV